MYITQANADLAMPCSSRTVRTLDQGPYHIGLRMVMRMDDGSLGGQDMIEMEGEKSLPAVSLCARYGPGGEFLLPGDSSKT